MFPTEPPDGAPLRLRTLGRAALLADGGAVILAAGKPLALLTYLHCSPGRAATREHLLDVFWADLEPGPARHALRQMAWNLRQTLGEDALLTRGSQLALALPLAADRDEFLAAVESGDLERAVDRYEGPFFPGFAAPGGAEFEHWADLERDRLRSLFARTGEQLARRWLSEARLRDAQRLARRVRDADPLDERGWRLLLESLVAGRDLVQAVVEADALDALLAQEGRTAEPATRAALAAARQAPVVELARERGLVAELVGREREFAAVVGAWETARRGPAVHVHLEAPAGHGKTRLLFDVQARLRTLGARCVYLRANPGERELANAFAGDLARALGRLPGAAGLSSASAGVLVALHPALSSTFAAPPQPPPPGDATRQHTLALADLLAAAAHEAPVAALLDDLHWLDDESYRVLLGILRRLEHLPVLVVTAARPEPDRSVESPGTLALRPEPLGPQHTRDLVASIAAPPDVAWLDRVAETLHRATGGSPLLLLETLQLAIDRGSLTLHDGAWAAADLDALLRDLAEGGSVEGRLAALRPAAVETLRALAVAGAPVGVEPLAAALGAGPAEVRERLLRLEQRGYVARRQGGWEPSHDEIARAALEPADGISVAALHHRLGRHFAATAGDDPDRTARAARHLAAAGATDELHALFRGAVRHARQSADRRSHTSLAVDLLGEPRSSDVVRQVVDNLPLRMRFRPPRPTRVAALLLLVAAAVAWPSALLLRDEPPPGALLLAAWRPSRDSIAAGFLPLRLEDWDRDAPLRVAEADPRFRLGDLPDLFAAPEPGPGGSSLLFARQVADSGVIDLFRIRRDVEQRLTRAAREDLAPQYSPDGRWIAFTTARWTPPGDDDADLALLDPASGTVRRLTGGSAFDTEPAWSPEGTRLAFVRRPRSPAPNRLCWVTPDASIERCVPLATDTLEPARVVGWVDPRRVLVEAQSVERQLLVEVHVDRGTVEVVDAGPVSGAALSPDGRWLAVRAERPAGSAPAWYVQPYGQPALARRVQALPDQPLEWIEWAPVVGRTRWLERLAIRAPDGAIPRDGTYRLRVDGFTREGRPLRPVPRATLRWRSGDPSVAVIDSSSGELTPRRAGAVWVHVSAGGWRRDSALVRIGP